MGIDSFSPTAPAQVNVLVLPAGKITKARYQSFVSRLRNANKVRLGDLSPLREASDNLFNPAAFPSGQISFNFSQVEAKFHNLEAFPFEINRESQVIIAVADGKRKTNSVDNEQNGTHESRSPFAKLADDLQALYDEYRRVLLSRLMVFDGDVEEHELQDDRVMLVPDPGKSNSTTMKTLMCDIASALLSRFNDLARDIQDLPVIESPWKQKLSAGLNGEVIDSIARVQQRMTMPARSPSGRDPSDLGTASISIPASARSPDGSRSGTPTGGRPASQLASIEHSQERMSTPSSANVFDRKQNRSAGRVAVVLGALYLQAGRWPDALRELERGLTTCRGMSDYLWHGRSLELIIACLLMFGYAGIGFNIPSVCYPATDKRSSTASGNVGSQPHKNINESLRDLAQIIPDIFSTVLTLYARAANFTQERLPQIMYFESNLRMVDTLSAIHLRGGLLDEEALQYLVDNHQLRPVKIDNHPIGGLNLRRHEIALMINQAMALKLEQLTTDEAIYILNSLGSRSSMLGLQRKQAFLIRELIEIIIPSLIHARKVGAAEMGIHPAAGLSALVNISLHGSKEVNSEATESNGLRPLLKTMTKIYGVYESSMKENETVAMAIADRNRRSNVGDTALKIDILRACANICEALPDLKGIVDFNAQLLEVTRGTLFMPEPHATGGPLIAQAEQTRLVNVIKRTVDAAVKFGMDDFAAEYWDDFLVRGIESIEHDPNMRLRSHTKKDLDIVGVGPDSKAKDPFIFNPFGKRPTSGKDEVTLVAGEPAYFRVTFQNPFDFDVEVDTLFLDTEGCDFEPHQQSLLIGPYCLQKIVMTGVPRAGGSLSMKGVAVKVRGCRLRTFRTFTTKPSLDEGCKLKTIGLGAGISKTVRPLSTDSTKLPSKLSSFAPDAPLSIFVIQQQPILSVKSCSLPHPALMLIEGESKAFDIILHNTSKDIPVDFLLFTFQDSATRQVQNALSNRELHAGDLYDLQLMLVEKPTIKLKSDFSSSSALRIAPNSSATYTVEIVGRPGLLDGTIQIDYAYLGNDGSADVANRFYTRQISVPIAVTVNAGLDLVRCNILPFSGDFAWTNQQISQQGSMQVDMVNGLSPQSQHSRDISTNSGRKLGNQFTSLLSRLGVGIYGDDHCLVLLDLRNGWPTPLTITIQVREQLPRSSSPDPWSRAYAVHETIQPGHTSRSVLLVPRFFIPNPHEPIPTLGSARQFVVSSSKISPDTEKANREAFWFREKLLTHIRGSWTDDSTGREGFIDLRRALRLNRRMVEALRIQDVEISMQVFSLNDTSASVVEQTGKSHFTLRTNQFAKVCTTIHNRSPGPLAVVLRLQPSIRDQPHPVALDLVKRFAWTGMLQQALYPPINAGEKRKVELGIIALCEGSYEIGATVEEMVPEAVDEETVIATPPHRRIWHSRYPCMIDALEGDPL